MKNIDEKQLEEDVQYRFKYICEFMGFGEDDIKTILSAAELLAPIVPGLVDEVYKKLFDFDCTKRHFVPRQDGYDGLVPNSLVELTLDRIHPQVEFRKQHLGKYFVRLVTGPYDAKMVKYLDAVGKMHTNQLGNKEIDIPLVQMNSLMGFVSDAILNAILGMDIPQESKVATVRAFNKLLWIQQDLISRHYVA